MTTMPNDAPLEGKQYTLLLMGVRLVPEGVSRKTTSHPFELLYLRCHAWRCGWYWQLGECVSDYGTYDFKSTFLKAPEDVDKVFYTPAITNKQWWRVMDYMKQAYALKDAAMVYQYGGHLANNKLANDIVNKTAADELNADAEVVLRAAWSILEQRQRAIDMDHRIDNAIKAMEA